MNRIGLGLLWAVALASALFALTVGPTLDDYVHAWHTMGGTTWSHYDFFGADRVPTLRFHGKLLPWWSSDQLSMRFFRPLSSLVLTFDHRFLDGGGVLSHVHGLAWFALLLAVVHRLFQVIIGAERGRWATALYAVCSWHALPLSFTASRHTHVTAVFAFSAFLCLARGARRPGWRWLAAVVLAVALLAGESALLVLPLVVGWAIGAHGFRKAASEVAPCLGVGFAYSLWYAWSGYGVVGSGQYLQPLTAEFLWHLPLRWTALLADLFGSFSADLSLFGLWPAQVSWGIAAIASLSVVSRRFYDDTLDRPVAGMVLGAAISLVAAGAAMPGGRALVIPGIAASAVFGTAISRCVARVRGSRWLLAWVLAFGIGLHPILRVVIALDFADSGRRIVASARMLSEQCRERTVLAPAMNDLSLVFVPYVIRMLELPEPDAVHVLSISPNEHQLERVGSSSYRLRIAGDFFASPWTRNQRATALQVGSTTRLDGLVVEVVAADPKAELLLSIGVPADLCWVTQAANGLLVFEPGDLRTWSSGE